MSSSAMSSTPCKRSTAPKRPLRRLALELFGVVALKIGLLMLIWWVAFAPHHKPDTSADAIANRLAPTATNTAPGRP
ncbi:MAG: cytochrome oxidase putative small subunit CydP [Thermomonas sp.]